MEQNKLAINASGLLAEFLEVVTHQVLFIRKVYDPKTFEERRYCDTFVHKNRHPGVVNYIKKSVEALHNCLENSDLDSFHVIIFDETCKPIEKTSLLFKALQLSDIEDGDSDNLEKVFQMYLRSLCTHKAILNDLPEGITFEIMAHTKRTKPDLDVWCEEIDDGLALSSSSLCTPIRSISYGNVLKMQLSIETLE